ncbi:hypothetical protein GW916_04825 [bacterium]|nr:hypothetical protein [bacterium]
MGSNIASEAALSRIKKLQKSLELSLKEISKQVRTVDKRLQGFKTSLGGLSKNKTQEKLMVFLGKSRKELLSFQSKVEKQVETLKVQAKAITEAERAKRRARSRSK